MPFDKQNKKTSTMESKKDESVKKPFDKKKYRLQKYSNKYRVQQWEEKKTQAIKRKYVRELSKDKRNFSAGGEGQQNNKSQSNVKIDGFFKAKQEFIKKQEEQRRSKDEFARKHKEREEAMKKYKENKLKKLKIISQKTKKGQPLMKNRMKFLLEKIQQGS